MPGTSSLTETVIVAYLRSPLDVSILDAASWAKTFSEEFNITQQTAPAAPFNLVALPNQTAFGMVTGLEIPRLILRSSKLPFVIQLQADRFAFGWARRKALGEQEDYIGYLELRKVWSKYYEKHCEWFRDVYKAEPDIGGAEITYTNALPLVRPDGTARKLADVFRFLMPGGRPVNAYSSNWSELLYLATDAPRVNAFAGVGTNTVSGENAIFFNFTGVGAIEIGGGKPAFMTMLDTLHERIHEMHIAAIAET